MDSQRFVSFMQFLAEQMVTPTIYPKVTPELRTRFFEWFKWFAELIILDEMKGKDVARDNRNKAASALSEYAQGLTEEGLITNSDLVVLSFVQKAMALHNEMLKNLGRATFSDVAGIKPTLEKTKQGTVAIVKLPSIDFDDDNSIGSAIGDLLAGRDGK